MTIQNLHRKHHHHEDEAEMYKQHALRSKQMRKMLSKGLFAVLCIIAVLLVSFIAFVSYMDI